MVCAVRRPHTAAPPCRLLQWRESCRSTSILMRSGCGHDAIHMMHLTSAVFRARP